MKKRLLTILICAALTVQYSACGISGNAETSQAPDPITIEVTDGDTVWDIAKHFKSDDKEIRKAVYEICQANNIPDGSIQSGMILTIPENL